ncbi:hypothetical protein GCM10027031_22430 [Corynebacterium atrinae]
MGNNGLRREGNDAFTGIDPGTHPINKWEQKRQTAGYGAGVAAQALNNRRLTLGNQRDRFNDDDGDEYEKNCEKYEFKHELIFLPNYGGGAINADDGDTLTFDKRV